MTSESILTRKSLIDFEWRFLNVHNIIIYSIFISLYVFQKQNTILIRPNEVKYRSRLPLAFSCQLYRVAACDLCACTRKKAVNFRVVASYI